MHLCCIASSSIYQCILNLAVEASKAVVHIHTPKGMGTGFLIAPDLGTSNFKNLQVE
jgi:hypothetical protein